MDVARAVGWLYEGCRKREQRRRRLSMARGTTCLENDVSKGRDPSCMGCAVTGDERSLVFIYVSL
jgi:hypothetical protein